MYESEPLFQAYLIGEVRAKAKQMRFRHDIQTFTHPSQAWRALVTWVEDAAPNL